ncbi:Cys/Met metabolism PLP-dependent enzyme-domain-containing protein [Baffinella frigidus]|nr:Cys/Met metabolism PLP-dependent enzyme-domain-containing protein [Cryptophyta sp. CCMP2293]
MSTAFVFRDAEHGAKLFNLEEVGYIYSRLTNPTVGALQSRMADLEGGAGAVCTSCGHSAQLLAMFALMEPGDTIVAATRLYGGTVQQLTNMIKKFGWKCEFVDVSPETRTPETRNPKPETRNPKPDTRHPTPEILTTRAG